MNSYQASRSPGLNFSRAAYPGSVLAAALSLLLLTAAVPGETPAVYAIRGIRIVPVAGATIDKGTIIIRDGLIQSVAAGEEVPADAQVIEGADLTAYPGLFDTYTYLGTEEPTPRSTRRGGSGPRAGRQGPPPPNMSPYMRVADHLTRGGGKLKAAREAGITTALAVPRRGIFAGQSALINLGGDAPGKMVVKASVALHLGMRSRGGGFPGSLMGVTAFIKQGFMDARHYTAVNHIYTAHKRGIQRPSYSRSLEALKPFVEGRQPVAFSADSAVEIERAINLAESLHINYILSGVREGYKVPALLKEKNVPVLVSLRFPEKDKDADPDAEEPLRVLKFRAEAPGNAAALQRAGVKFAFHSGLMSNPKTFLKNAAKAVQAGLSKDAALRALTLNAAEIFGVADQLGSIEKGKIANLVIADGDLFDAETRLRYVFVDGQEFELKAEKPKKDEEGKSTERVNATGTWDLLLDTDQGTLEVTADISQQGDQVSGTVTSELGEADIVEGAVDGNKIQFTVSFEMNGQMIDVEFVGAIEGDKMTGNANSMVFGSIAFTGSRSPGEEEHSQ